jgi:integrase
MLSAMVGAGIKGGYLVLALNGLRVSEATGADIEHLGLECDHRTLVITRKGGKVITIPLAPRTARAVDLAIGERTSGPLFTGRTGGGWTGTVRHGLSAGSPGAPGSPSTWAHTLMHSLRVSCR